MTFTKESKRKWLEVCGRLSSRDRDLVGLVLASLAVGAAEADHAFTSEDLIELSRITVQGL